MAREKNLDTGELAGFLSPSGAKERKRHSWSYLQHPLSGSMSVRIRFSRKTITMA